MSNIYNTYINAKKSLNKEVDNNNDGFKRIFSNGSFEDGESHLSEVRTEPYTKKPFKGDSFSEEKPRWLKEEGESTKEEKVDSGENQESENTSDDNKQQKEQTTAGNNNQEKEETENKTLNTVLEDINQLINVASNKLDGPFTYGSMADYLSEVITKSLLLLAIDEDTSQNINNSYTQQNTESEEKEINISNDNQEDNSENNKTDQSQPKEEKNSEENKEN